MAARTTRLLCLLLAALLLAGCGAASPTQDPTTAPESSGAAVDFPGAARTEQALSQINALGVSPDDGFRTWYEIFVYSFRDSDGDGIGDLRGVMEGLDYLQELGVNGIWLMPVHPSTSYHKYNVSDYCAIDPDYGTMEDMEALLNQCRERGIRVILDLVVNHTGSDHPWFREAVAYLQELGEGEPDTAACPYAEYYNFSREAGAGYCQVPGTDWYYEARFSPDMPDLNLDSPLVRQEIESIMAFWLDKGAAGFRLDAAKEFFSGSTDRNIEVLRWLWQTLKSYKEDAYLVAGVVSRSILQGQLLHIGQVSAEALVQAMQGSKTVMLYVTLALVLQAIETCAVPIFAFLLVEGAQHTASFRNYFLRVAALAVLCEIPYNLALSGQVLELSGRNPVFGAALGLALLYFYRRFPENTVTHWTVRAAATSAVLLWCSMLTVQNGGGMVLVTAVLWAFRKKPLLRSLAGATAVLLCSVGSMFYLAAPMAFLAVHFYNGEKGEQSRGANYLAYPGLLLAAALAGWVL